LKRTQNIQNLNNIILNVFHKIPYNIVVVIYTSKYKIGPLFYDILEYKYYILTLSRRTCDPVCTQNNSRKRMMLRGLKVPQAYFNSWPDIPHLLEGNWRVPHT
jgi:hypothetical protein